jgi:hypothetical protein
VTSQSTDLVTSVTAALSAFGFQVEDMDAVFPPGDRREDLRVHDGDWTAIAEVKGYKDGAKSGDLPRIQRFVTRYLRDEKHEPDAAWYVVNQFKDESPEARQEALRSQPDDLAAFAESPGLVIDTRDLLRLWLAVQRGDIDPSTARSLLKSSSGLFSYIPTPGTSI